MKKIAIITDFSKTITNHDNPTTWSVFAKSGLLGDDYIKERNNFFEKYHKEELNGNIENTKIWWKKHLELFIKYNLEQKLIDEIIKNKNYFKPRKGIKEFFNFIENNKNIDLFIISSGISNFIKSFLKYQEILLNNVFIYGNELILDNKDKVIGYNENSIITTLNKNIHNFELGEYEKIILIGDDESDLKIYNGDYLKIGFCDENIKGYDIYLGKEGDLSKLQEFITQ